MRAVWFIGSGPFAALCLARLKELLPPAGFDLARVWTGRPTLTGRRQVETPSPVEVRALELGLVPQRTGPISKNDEFLALLRREPPEAAFVVDFGQLVLEPLLSAPRWGCLNIHPSLLPRWRGASPIQRTLMNGDAQAGVTVFRLVREMDAGPVLRQAALPLDLETAASTLYEKLSALGAELAVDGLRALEGGEALTEQDPGGVTVAPKLSREEFEADWSWPALKIHNAVRGLEASGGASVPLRGARLKLWRTRPLDARDGAEPGRVLSLDREGPVVACGSGALRLEEVQAPGKRRVPGADWARGLRLDVGDGLA